MPRGRHRHSPPLHRLLPPSAIAGVSVVCAFGPWVFSQPAVLRVVAAVAAATAVVGAAVMRRWDTLAGKQVADLIRARASDEWRFEERVAELESDLEESRELRAKLEQRLRAKRTELAGLRNEHAALLRRYATAETERASALEGRRLLEIGATAPARALPPVPVAVAQGAGAVAVPVEGDVDADAAEAAETVQTAGTGEAGETGEARHSGVSGASGDSGDDESEAPAIFSPEGSKLFLRAKVALSRFGDGEGAAAQKGAGEASAGDSSGQDDAPEGAVEDDSALDGVTRSSSAKEGSVKDGSAKGGSPKGDGTPDGDGGPKGDGPAKDVPARVGPLGAEVGASRASRDSGDSRVEAAQEDEAQGKPAAVDGHERAAAVTPQTKPGPSETAQPSGHFVAPTAVAVAPTAPARRAAGEGGFDFFGTQKTSAALESVQNEDLADVVGQEALALHKAESEAEFKPAGEESRGIGQVIDLTAHDETEQIDVQGLRSAVS
ncbi:hypothetical protein [Streptomyces sp. NPDC020489]|uniref:hypothetical protein n=1 Tax=Streptomyces sp. NPDC020489 TaxID=3365077 RepID=UPI0037B37212